MTKFLIFYEYFYYYRLAAKNLWRIGQFIGHSTFILCSVIIKTIKHIVRRMVNVFIIGEPRTTLHGGLRYNVLYLNRGIQLKSIAIQSGIFMLFNACNRFRMVQCFPFIIYTYLRSLLNLWLFYYLILILGPSMQRETYL